MEFLTRLELYFFIGAICILIGVFTNNFSRKLGIPTLLIFLAVGMLAGSDGVGGIWFDNAPLAQTVGITAMIFILFIGGLDTNESNFRRIARPGVTLAIFGVIISALLIAVFSIYLLKLSFWEGLLLGGIISSSDAVAVFSILRSKEIKIKESIRGIIEFESATNDPMAIFLVIIILQVITLPSLTTLSLIKIFLLQFSVGALGGFLFGKLMSLILNKSKFSNENFYFIVSISLVLLCYSLTQLLQGSGFLAVYFAGLVLGKSNFARKKSMIVFHDTLAWLLQVVMFLILGLFVFPKNLLNFATEGLILTIFLVFFARPISVLLCLIGSKFYFREKLLISWGGFRGATPIVLALYPLTAKIPNAELIFEVVFIVVFISILIQAPSFSFVTKLLGLTTEQGYAPRFPLGFTVTQKLKSHLKEYLIEESSLYRGKNLIQIAFPPTIRVVLIQRDQDVIAPRGTTVLEKGDILLILSTDTEFDKL